MSPHVQAVQIMCGKGGKRVLKAKLRAAEDDPRFEKIKRKLSKSGNPELCLPKRLLFFVVDKINFPGQTVAICL